MDGLFERLIRDRAERPYLNRLIKIALPLCVLYVGFVASFLAGLAVVSLVGVEIPNAGPRFGTVADLQAKTVQMTAQIDNGYGSSTVDPFLLTDEERQAVVRLLGRLSFGFRTRGEICYRCRPAKPEGLSKGGYICVNFYDERGQSLGYRIMAFSGPPYEASVERPNAIYPTESSRPGECGETLLSSAESIALARLIAANAGLKPEAIIDATRCAEDCIAADAVDVGHVAAPPRALVGRDVGSAADPR